MAEKEEFEGFVDIGQDTEDVHDPKVQPTGNYNLTVSNAKGEVADDGNGVKYVKTITAQVDFDDVQGAATIFHRMAMPKPDDDKKKADFKILMAKKFYKLFGVPVGPRGFNTTDLIGARATSVLVDYKGEQEVSQADGSTKTYPEQNAINLRGVKV